MEFAGLLLLALVLAGASSRRKTEDEAPGSSAAPPDAPAASDGGDLVKTTLGIVGSLVTGGGATVATTGGTATGTAGALTATKTAVTTTAVTAGSVTFGTVFVGVIANPIAWVVAVLIATRISQGMAHHKTWASWLLNCNANAEGLHAFEREAMPELLKGQTYTREEVRDGRLDIFRSGVDPIKVQGWRTVFRYVESQGLEIATWQLRAQAMHYLTWRAFFAYWMIRHWNVVNPESDFGMSPRKRAGLYERELPGVGGLDHIPMPHGRTEAPRVDPGEPWPSDPRELRGTGIAEDSLSEEQRKVAEFAGLLDALYCLRWDPRFAIDADRTWYARDVFTACKLEQLGVTLSGEWFHFDPKIWTAALSVNPLRIKNREKGAVLLNGADAGAPA